MFQPRFDVDGLKIKTLSLLSRPASRFFQKHEEALPVTLIAVLFRDLGRPP